MGSDRCNVCVQRIFWLITSYRATLEDAMNIGSPHYTHDMCKEMASHMIHTKSLPEGCKKYKDVVTDLQRRDSDTTHPTSFLG